MDAATQKRWAETSHLLHKMRLILTEQRGARDQLTRVRDAEKDSVEELRERQQVAHQAYLFLLSEISDRRKHAIESIEQIASAALRLVYGPGHGLLFEQFEEKRRGEGASNFRMEIKLRLPYEGGELITGLMGEVGGGMIEMVACALRMAALNWRGYDGPLIFDEAWKSMSNDRKLESVARFLRMYADQTGRQIIFATHKADVFSQVADRILRVTNVDGVSNVESIDATRDVEMDDEDFS